ncbi:MAG: patatin-like phospholipase family protein [Treponema sp.]|nr:patatin-like phospholipase family protein [Treponema sp.]
MEKISVIVEGGGMRGMYAAGILDCFIQRNMYWNNTYGVSAGSCHALSYISRQFDRARRVNVNHVKKARYSGPLCLLRHGTYFGFDYIFRTIPATDCVD